MRLSLFKKFLSFSLFGMALWGYGNLYEAIVIAPNLLKDSAQKITAYRSFFSITNPAFYYVPISLLAVLIIPMLYFKAPKASLNLRKRLKQSSIYGLMALVLGIYIITQINLKLFFSSALLSDAEAWKLSLRWNILNGIRLVLLAFTLFHIFKATISVSQND